MTAAQRIVVCSSLQVLKRMWWNHSLCFKSACFSDQFYAALRRTVYKQVLMQHTSWTLYPLEDSDCPFLELIAQPSAWSIYSKAFAVVKHNIPPSWELIASISHHWDGSWSPTLNKCFTFATWSGVTSSQQQFNFDCHNETYRPSLHLHLSWSITGAEVKQNWCVGWSPAQSCGNKW